MYQSGKSAQIAKEMDRYNIEILGLSEVRWNTSGMTTISTGHTIIYSGYPNKVDPHEKGDGFLLNKTSKKSLLEWNPNSPRIVTARFDTKFQKTTCIQVYAPKNEVQEIEKDFYNALQYAVDKIPKRDIFIIMGDLNAKVGSERIGRERKIRLHDIGNKNENGELFADKGDIKFLYNTTRQLSGRPPITNSPVKDSNGKVISKNEEQLKQLKKWKEHF
jgi:exonuclease III